MHVKVTVAVGRRVVAAEDVSDANVKSALRQAGREMGAKLGSIACPEHGKSPWNVRIHFASTGAGDLKYESCCEKLGKKVRETLG
jgi:hypothetical protein